MKLFSKLKKAFLVALFIPASGTLSASDYTLVTILHTNDLHGRVVMGSKPGGLARIATIVKRVRSEAPNVLLFDTGDIFHGTNTDYLNGGKATTAVMSSMGYDFASLGNHELDYGVDKFKDAASSVCFKFLAANLRSASGGDWDGVGSYAIREIDGIRIAVLGLTTSETVSLHWPGAVKDIKVEDGIETAKMLMPQIKSEADVVIVLSHLGDPLDKKLAREVPGIDFILGGHSHTTGDNWNWSGETLISQTGAYAKNLGRIDFIVSKKDNSASIVSVNGKNGSWNNLTNPPLGLKFPESPLIPVDNTIPEDIDALAVYKPYADAAACILSEHIITLPMQISGSPVSSGESPAGDLVADAVKAFGCTDLGFVSVNSVSLNGLPSGHVTVGCAFDLISGFTRLELISASVLGSDLAAALSERIKSRASLGLNISGAEVSYTIDGAQILVNGSPIVPENQYTFTAPTFVMTEIMANAPSTHVIHESDRTLREAVVDYLRSHPEIKPPSATRIRRHQ